MSEFFAVKSPSGHIVCFDSGELEAWHALQYYRRDYTLLLSEFIELRKAEGYRVVRFVEACEVAEDEA